MLTNNICHHAMQNKICLHLIGIGLDPSSGPEYMNKNQNKFFLKMIMKETNGQRKFVNHIPRVFDLAMVVYSN